jgi:hypothetical protein
MNEIETALERRAGLDQSFLRGSIPRARSSAEREALQV